MNDDAKKTALRMIPYGLYVMTAMSKDGTVIAASTVNWVTQTAFAPPLLVVGVKKDSGAHSVAKDAGVFALNILGKDQGNIAYAFFKATERAGDTVNGQPFRHGSTGAPLLEAVPAWVECRLVETVERGDHSVFIAEVIEAGLKQPIEGRPDDATLTLKDLGPKVFYGG
ncbi:MAG: flavin reductase family protein [Gammaproteobacteria bacterium]